VNEEEQSITINLTMAYGKLVVMLDLNFEVADKDIFCIIGGGIDFARAEMLERPSPPWM